MSERALKLYINNLSKYVAEIKKTETKEQSKAALIRTGILNKDGSIKKEYKGIVE